MDKLLTVTKDEKQVFFSFSDLDMGRTEILTKLYFPKVDLGVGAIYSLAHGDDVNPQRDFTLEDVLKNQIDLFLNHCKDLGHKLHIVFENNDMQMTTYLRKNYDGYLLTRRDMFNRHVIGVTPSKKIRDSYYDSDISNGVRDNLTINNYIFNKNKSL